MQTQYDVVIVGSGVAGALLAYRLSNLMKGARILLMDAGDNPLDDAMRERFVDAFALSSDRGVLSPYRRMDSNKFVTSPESGADTKHYVQNVSEGATPFKSNYVRMTGGSTWAWRGNCPRWVPADFRMKSLYGIADDWPFTYEDIEDYFCEAEHELGVAGDHEEQQNLNSGVRSRPYPMPKIAQAVGDQIIKKRVDGVRLEGKKLTVVATPQARNSQAYNGRPPCQGNANCIPICPSGAKYDAGIHINKADANGVHVQRHAAVTRLDVDTNGAITGVRYRDWRESGSPEKTVSGKIVVLALNAIETPRLWLHSGLKNDAKIVGTRLMDHLAGEVTGYMDVPIYPFRGPQNTSSIFDFRDGDFRTQNAAFNITIGNDGWGRKLAPTAVMDKALWDENSGRIARFGRSLRRELAEGDKAITKMIRVGYSTEQLPNANNRVSLASAAEQPLGIPRPEITYQLDDYTLRSLEFGHHVAFEILKLAVGGDENRIDKTKEKQPAYNGAGHPMGTCRMGTSEKDSVVDQFGCAHAHPNLFLVGSSVFVTGSSVNPTLLLAALTIRTAERIAQNP